MLGSVHMLRLPEGRGDVIFSKKNVFQMMMAKLDLVRQGIIHFSDVFFTCKYLECVHSTADCFMLAIQKFDSTKKRLMPALFPCPLYIYRSLCFQYGKLSLFANTQLLSNSHILSSSIAHCLFRMALTASITYCMVQP